MGIFELDAVGCDRTGGVSDDDSSKVIESVTSWAICGVGSIISLTWITGDL